MKPVTFPRRHIFVLLLPALILLFSSCEKEVHINLQSVPPSLVVQGNIETGQPPFVVLTNTMGFFSKIDLGTLQNTFVHDAVVRVSDGSRTVTLKEYTIDSSSFKFSFYSLDIANPSDTMFGLNGNTYTLTIEHDGKTYTSRTKIPEPKGVDTMWFDVPQFAGTTTPDSAKQLFVKYTDPDSLGNYVRCFTSRNNDPFYYSANFSDEVVNGKTINNIGLAAGYREDGTDGNRDSLIYFFPGETVTLKWCAVDRRVYNFWNTLDFAKSAVGNPFSSPINPETNIDNGAVGVWAGYGTLYYTATVPH